MRVVILRHGLLGSKNSLSELGLNDTEGVSVRVSLEVRMISEVRIFVFVLDVVVRNQLRSWIQIR